MNLSKDYMYGFRDGHEHGYVAGYEAARKEIAGDACVRCWECVYFNHYMLYCKKHGGPCTGENTCPQGKRRAGLWDF